jgi:hypothetical protein
MMHGQITFTDEKNGLTGYLDIGSIKKKPRDYFVGHILSQGQTVSKVSGTYMGYADFDDDRFFDLRHSEPYPI